MNECMNVPGKGLSVCELMHKVRSILLMLDLKVAAGSMLRMGLSFCSNVKEALRESSWCSLE